ncbi:MAG: hypothetical protein IKI64_00725 [Clostridia bacterium]|nr:hypothetical protein [Clostridia bacterium]
MIDIHNHIVWGIDDGAHDEQVALEMGAIAVSAGITDIIATPHCIPGAAENYCGPGFDARLDRLRELLRAEKATARLNIHRGMEVFACESTVEDLEKGRICCLAQSNYMLIECDFDEDPWFFRDVLIGIIQRGIRPVIAHPERYYFAQDSTRYLYDLVNMGCALQLDSLSITGDFGRSCRSVALELLDSSAVQLVGSDAHDTDTRSPDMRDAAEFVAANYSPNYAGLLFHENPKRIIANMPLLFRGQAPGGGRSGPSSRFMTDEEYWGV